MKSIEDLQAEVLEYLHRAIDEAAWHVPTASDCARLWFRMMAPDFEIIECIDDPEDSNTAIVTYQLPHLAEYVLIDFEVVV